MAKMLYRKDTGEILGVHIIGLHAADLIHEASNAIATNQRVQVGVGRAGGRAGPVGGQGSSGVEGKGGAGAGAGAGAGGSRSSMKE